jgi:hypothetical protein
MQQLMLGMREAALVSEHGTTTAHHAANSSARPALCCDGADVRAAPPARACGNLAAHAAPALLCHKIADSLCEAEALQLQVAALMGASSPPPHTPKVPFTRI